MSQLYVPGPARIYVGTDGDMKTMVLFAPEQGDQATGAVAYATVSAGAVTAVTVVDGGSGFTHAPTVLFSPPGWGARGTAVVADGEVVSVTVTAGGSGYISAATAPSYEFLGFSESAVRFTPIARYTDEEADYAGMMPADVGYHGESASIIATLKRFNYDVYDKVRARLRGGTVGKLEACDMGSIIETEGRYIPVIITSPYPTCKPTFYGDMPAGYRLPFCYLSRQTSATYGLRPTKIPILIQAEMLIDPLTGAGFLFDRAVSEAPAPN